MTDSAPLVVIPHARFIEYQARHRAKAAQSAERDRLLMIMVAEPDAPVTSDNGTSERFAEAMHVLKAAFGARAAPGAAPAGHVEAVLPQPTTGASRT